MVVLLKEIAPRVSRVAFLFNPATATYFEYYLKPFKAAAPSFEVEAIAAPVHDASELEFVVAAQARSPNTGLIVMPDGFMNVRRAEVILMAARYQLPAVYPFRFSLNSVACFATELSRAISFDLRRLMSVASCAARGPSTLAVQAPTKFELVINLKTAKTLGLAVSPTLLTRADAVIE